MTRVRKRIYFFMVCGIALKYQLNFVCIEQRIAAAYYFHKLEKTLIENGWFFQVKPKHSNLILRLGMLIDMH